MHKKIFQVQIQETIAQGEGVGGEASSVVADFISSLIKAW